MPLDDVRPARLARPTPTPPPTPSAEEDELYPCCDPDCEQCDPNTLAQRQAEFDRRLMAELQQEIEDIDAGRAEPGVPWEVVRAELLADMADYEESRSRRARH